MKTLKAKLGDSCKVLDVDGSSELILVTLYSDEPTRRFPDTYKFVKVIDPSDGSEVLLAVPIDDERIKVKNEENDGYHPMPILTCKHAVAWTWDMMPEDYNPVVET